MQEMQQKMQLVLEKITENKDKYLQFVADKLGPEKIRYFYNILANDCDYLKNKQIVLTPFVLSLNNTSSSGKSEIKEKHEFNFSIIVNAQNIILFLIFCYFR